MPEYDAALVNAAAALATSPLTSEDEDGAHGLDAETRTSARAYLRHCWADHGAEPESETPAAEEPE